MSGILQPASNNLTPGALVSANSYKLPRKRAKWSYFDRSKVDLSACFYPIPEANPQKLPHAFEALSLRDVSTATLDQVKILANCTDRNATVCGKTLDATVNYKLRNMAGWKTFGVLI